MIFRTIGHDLYFLLLELREAFGEQSQRRHLHFDLYPQLHFKVLARPTTMGYNPT